MRIITNSLEQIAGLDILASGLLVVFFILFLWIVYRIVRTSSSDAKQWGNLPFDNNTTHNELNMNNSNSKDN